MIFRKKCCVVVFGQKVTQNECYSGFELSISRSWSTICFSIFRMPKKFHFIIFAIQNSGQNTKKNTHEFYLCCWDHVCKVNEWCLADCFSHKYGVSTQIMVHDYCIANCKKSSACGGPLMALWSIFFTIIKSWCSEFLFLA